MKAALVTAALAAILTAPAHAAQPSYCYQSANGGPPAIRPFVCSRADDNAGPSLNWPGKKATYKINVDGTQDIAGDQELAVIRAAFKTWESVQGPQFSASFQFTDGGMTASRRVGYDFLHVGDNESEVVFQSQWTHEPLVIGLTTATFNAQTGEIFDADIELNDQHFTFTIGDANVLTDLQNTVTHEVGHFLGFDHTDKAGSQIPSECASQATMSSVSKLGEITKRVLAPSDQLGMAFVYPADKSGVQYVFAPDAAPTKPPRITQMNGACNGSGGAMEGMGGIAAPLAMMLALRRRPSGQT